MSVPGVDVVSTVNARGTALHIALEAPYVRDPGGRIWTDEGIGPDHLQAHIATFGLVRLVVRVRDVASPRSGAQRIDESALTVAPLPYYQGLGGLLRTFPQLIAALWRESGTASSSLLLLPGPIGTLFGSCLALRPPIKCRCKL